MVKKILARNKDSEVQKKFSYLEERSESLIDNNVEYEIVGV